MPAATRGAVALFGYALAFSLAYVRIGAATGAWLLFGAVQATMLGEAIGWRSAIAALVVVGGVAIAIAPSR